MVVKPNGTHAKDIALYYLKITEQRATPQIVAKTISQAKSLLNAGYTKQEIMDVMEHVVFVKKVDVYSIGYFNACINDVLRELKVIKEKEKAEEQAKLMREKMQEQQNLFRKEVSDIDESTERNRQKARRFNVQSREREKYSFDLFEG